MKEGEYISYSISSHGQVSGIDEIKEEITHRGPVACEICVNDKFSDYKNGIFEGDTECDADNKHFIELAGWNIEGDIPYWIGRNRYKF